MLSATAISNEMRLDTDLSNVGDVLGVAGLDHDRVVVGPQDGGPHADGQVRGGHHVLLRENKEIISISHTELPLEYFPVSNPNGEYGEICITPASIVAAQNEEYCLGGMLQITDALCQNGILGQYAVIREAVLTNIH